MRRTDGHREDVPYLSREDIEAEAALVLAEFGQWHPAMQLAYGPRMQS
jgi:hypothetical protein